MNDNSFYSDTVAACLHLIHDYAPIMMRAGGGGIEAAGEVGLRVPLTDGERECIVRLHLKRGYSLRQVAEMVNRPQGTVGAVVAKYKRRGHANALPPGLKSNR